MNKVDALEILSTKSWAMYKPNEKGRVINKDGTVTNGAIFSGVQIVCTQDEWREIIVALHDGGE